MQMVLVVSFNKQVIYINSAILSSLISSSEQSQINLEISWTVVVLEAGAWPGLD